MATAGEIPSSNIQAPEGTKRQSWRRTPCPKAQIGDNPMMTLIADKKGRLTRPGLFPPGTSFDAKRDETGRIVLICLDGKKIWPNLVSPFPYKGAWLMPAELDLEQMVAEIRQERQFGNGGLLE